MVTGSVQGSKAPSSAEDQKEAGKEAAAKSFAEGDILWISLPELFLHICKWQICN